MNKIVGLVALFMIFEIVRAQEYRIVFSGSGASGMVDSLKIENLSKGTILKMKGGDVLVLKPSSTGILHIREDRETDLWVFPNPAVHTAYLEFTMKEAGRTTIDLTDLSGKTVAFGNFVLEPGRHSFLLHLPGTGLFTARIRTGRFSASCRVSATGSRDVEAAITPLGTQPLNIRNVALKNALTEVTMAYSKGERLKIT